MDNFINNLKDISIDPKNTSWLKLENRLHEDSIYIKPKRDNKFIISSLVASFLILITAGFFLFRQPINNLGALQGFALEDMERYSSNDDNGIYNISQLQDLHLAYNKYNME